LISCFKSSAFHVEKHVFEKYFVFGRLRLLLSKICGRTAAKFSRPFFCRPVLSYFAEFLPGWQQCDLTRNVAEGPPYRCLPKGAA
jgi:hypothetical protein